MDLTAGLRLRSSVDDVEVVVVKAPDRSVDVRCGGHPMVRPGDGPVAAPAAEPGFAEGTLLGKRYTDREGTIELLCTKGGQSSLSIGDTLLVQKSAKPLPSSD